MKKLCFILLLFNIGNITAQKIENVIIVTTDGFRWQEVFAGMDSAIANNKEFNQWDSANLYKNYWDESPVERRKKLLPFLWSTIEKDGQIYGNRNLGNKVNVANRYWFSYPGYNEIFTGYPDTFVNSNSYKANPNTTLTEFLNRQPGFKNRVAAFGAWNAFTRILNKERSGVPVVNAFDKLDTKNAGPNGALMNQMLQDSYKPFGNDECLDVFTHQAAIQYFKSQ